jgi:hypothetical protein
MRTIEFVCTVTKGFWLDVHLYRVLQQPLLFLFFPFLLSAFCFLGRSFFSSLLPTLLYAILFAPLFSFYAILSPPLFSIGNETWHINVGSI